MKWNLYRCSLVLPAECRSSDSSFLCLYICSCNRIHQSYNSIRHRSSQVEQDSKWTESSWPLWKLEINSWPSEFIKIEILKYCITWEQGRQYGEKEPESEMQMHFSMFQSLRIWKWSIRADELKVNQPKFISFRILKSFWKESIYLLFVKRLNVIVWFGWVVLVTKFVND